MSNTFNFNLKNANKEMNKARKEMEKASRKMVQDMLEMPRPLLLEEHARVLKHENASLEHMIAIDSRFEAWKNIQDKRGIYLDDRWTLLLRDFFMANPANKDLLSMFASQNHNRMLIEEALSIPK